MKKNNKLLMMGLVLIVLIMGYMYWNDQARKNAPLEHKMECVTNLKQIGIAFRVWSGEHGGQFPFNVTTNEGGTREITDIVKNGFAADPLIHFAALTKSGEINSPLTLICPFDKKGGHDTEMRGKDFDYTSYRLRVGPNLNITNATEILVICPNDGNILYCDGRIVEAQPGAKDEHRLSLIPK